MGRIVTTVTAGNLVEPGYELRCDALVDTGAYCLTLPAAWKERLGLVVDMLGHRLVRVPHLDLKRACRRAA